MSLRGIVAPEAVPEIVPGSKEMQLLQGIVHALEIETTLGGRGIAGQGAVPEIVPGSKEMRLLQGNVHALEIETTPGGIVAPEAALKIAPGIEILTLNVFHREMDKKHGTTLITVFWILVFFEEDTFGTVLLIIKWVNISIRYFLKKKNQFVQLYF